VPARAAGGFQRSAAMKSRTIRSGFWLWVIPVILVCAKGAPAELSANYRYFLEKAITSPKPDIAGNTINYSLDLVFTSRPEYFWSYYNSVDRALIIDLYGGHVKPVRMKLPATTPFKEINIRNLSTRMTLSGKQAQIVISLDGDWHIESQPLGNTTIHLIIWKEAKIQKEEIKPKRAHFFYAYVAAAVAAAWAVLGIVMAIQKNA
jgi:hypothetical protein